MSTSAASLEDLLAAVRRLEAKVDAALRPPPKLLSKRAAAKLLGVDRGTTLEKMLSKHHVSFVGRRIRGEDLEEIVNRKRRARRKSWGHVKRPSGCTICGHPRDLHWHHIVPLAEEGQDHLSNLIALCPNCHAAAHHGRLPRVVLLAHKESKK